MHMTSVKCIEFQTIDWQDWPTSGVAGSLVVLRVAPSDGVELMPYLHSLLSPDETERAARYHHPNDQLRFGYTRGLLRVLLGQYTNQSPNRIEFVAGINRKPELTGSVGWHFNVSHSAHWVLIALGKVPVGVDLERINPDFPFQDVLQASFGPSEQRYINACSDARSGFYQLWTRKEALVKATAQGLDDTFDRVPSLPGVHRVAGKGGGWTVRSFTVADGYPAAVAYADSAPVPPQFYTLRAERLVGAR